MVVLNIILILLLAISAFMNFNLYSNLEKLEESYTDLQEIAESDETFVLELRKKIMEQLEKLRELDRIGAFESDDEVGFFFKELEQIILDISSEFKLNLDSTGDKV